MVWRLVCTAEGAYAIIEKITHLICAPIEDMNGNFVKRFSQASREIGDGWA